MPLPKGTRLDAEIHWDNSAQNPRNPSVPPVRMTWGEQSKDEMGSVTLITVPHEQQDLRTLRGDYLKHRNQMAHERMMKDPALALKILSLLAQ